MKRLILLLTICTILVTAGYTTAKPFQRMTRHQVHNAQRGNNLYHYKNGKISKNHGKESAYLPFYNRKK